MKTKLQWFEQFKEEFLDGNGKYVNDETKHIPRFIERIQNDKTIFDCLDFKTPISKEPTEYEQQEQFLEKLTSWIAEQKK